MLDAVLWGLIQGLTEFLPISSSGHLVLVPAFLTELGWAIDEPELAVNASLHLGTLLAVLLYYRRDLAMLLRPHRHPQAPRILWLLILGTVPALVGLPLESALDDFEESPQRVAGALLVTTAVLVVGWRLRGGDRTLEKGTWRDAVVVGIAQAMALVPGVSRSGMTIAAGLSRRLGRLEAARYSFLLSIPTIAGGGLISLVSLDAGTTDMAALFVGMAVAFVSGYLAIAVLLRALVRVGLGPFAVYTAAVAVTGLLVF